MEERIERPHLDTPGDPQGDKLGGNIYRCDGHKFYAAILLSGEKALKTQQIPRGAGCANSHVLLKPYSNAEHLRISSLQVRTGDLFRAFTLIELLVVVGIIAILAGLLLPALARAKAKARRIECLSRIRRWTLGLIFYADVNEGWIPREGFSTDGNVAWQLGHPIGFTWKHR